MADILKQIFFRNYFNYLGLTSGYIIVGIIILSCDGFIHNNFCDQDLIYLIYLGFTMIWTIIWFCINFYTKYYIPKFRNDKIGIYILCNNIKCNMSLYNYVKDELIHPLVNDEKFEIIDCKVINPCKSSYLNNRLKEKGPEYFDKYNPVFVLIGNLSIELDKVSKKKFVFDRYYYRAFMHPVTKEYLKTLTREFFMEETSDYQFKQLSTSYLRYMFYNAISIGYSSVGNYANAISINQEIMNHCKDELDRFDDGRHTKSLMYFQFCSLVKLLIAEDKKKDALKLLKTNNDLVFKNYELLVELIYLEFYFDNNIDYLLTLTEKAKKLHPQDFVWKFHLAFFEAYRGDLSTSLTIYHKINNKHPKLDPKFLTDIIKFDIELIKNDSSFEYFNYVIGYIYFKMLGNYPMAIEYFDKVIADNNPLDFVSKAKEYLKQSKGVIGYKDSV